MLLTKTQIEKISKGKTFDLKLSSSLISAFTKHVGFVVNNLH